MCSLHRLVVSCFPIFDGYSTWMLWCRSGLTAQPLTLESTWTLNVESTIELCPNLVPGTCPLMERRAVNGKAETEPQTMDTCSDTSCAWKGQSDLQLLTKSVRLMFGAGHAGHSGFIRAICCCWMGVKLESWKKYTHADDKSLWLIIFPM